MSDTEFEDYTKASGVMGWFGRDPLFRVCILAEIIVWIIITSIASCFVCAIRRKCMRGKSRYYSPKDGSSDAQEMKQQQKKMNGDGTTHVVVGSDAPYATTRGRLCYKYRHLWTLAVAVIIGFVSMVVLLVIALPFAMPHALFIPDGCHDADWCQTVPGAKNLFVKTESGNNVSVRLFPAHKSGKYYTKRFSLLYSNPNAGYTTRGYQVYEKLAAFGISVYAWDYPGYMLSSGSPSYASVMEAGHAVLRFVAAHSIKRPEDVILLGRSLGGAVSIALAEEHHSKALVLFNPLDSLRLLLGDCCVLSGWASGLHYAAGHFDAARSLSPFRGCLFQYAAEDDVIIYFQRQHKLFFDYADHKQKNCSVFVKGTCMGHNDDQWEQDSFVKALNLYFQKLNF